MKFLETITFIGDDALVPINRIKCINFCSNGDGYIIKIIGGDSCEWHDKEIKKNNQWRIKMSEWSLENIKKKFEDNNYFGLSTLIDLTDCDHDKIISPLFIEQYVVDLCDLIEMERFGEISIHHFGKNIKVQGYSFTQLIETSSIVGHFSEYNMGAYIDVFSCKPYFPEIVQGFTEKFFNSHHSHATAVFRR